MVKANAAVNLERPVFTGEHTALLNQIYDLIVKLWEEHYTSPIFAGDEMIFTLGGNGYTIILSHLGFRALVELQTPVGIVDLRPDSSSGEVSITKADSPDDLSADEILRQLSRGLIDYYERGPQLRV
jgi:hypothetical protein